MAEEATPIPVIDQREAALRVQSGGYDAAGKPAGPAMVDTQTPAPRAGMPSLASQPAVEPRKGWAVSNDEANAIIGASKPLLPSSAKVEQGSPSWLDYTASAARESNLAGAAYDRFINHPDASAPDVPGYNPFNNNGIAGYEDYASKFADSNSPQQTQVIKERIDQERQDKQIIGQAGGAGWATSMFFGVTDPTTLALMFVPGAGEVKGASLFARATRGAVGAAVAGEVQQAALTSIKETTDYTDNMIPRLATDALLGGTLGALLRNKVPKAEFDELANKADAAVNAIVPSESTGGAAAVRGTTLEQESFAKGGAWVAKMDAALPRWLASPTMRVMTSSPVVESRRLVQRIVDLGGGMLEKNKQGVATPTSVEMVTNQIVNSREAQIFRGVDDLFAEHAKNDPSPMSKHDFGAEILKALSNRDNHVTPEVAKAAKLIRPFFDADHEMLTKIAPDADYDILHKTADSYAPRVWDINKITADRTNFEDFLHQHFSTNPKTVPVPEATVKVQPPEPGKGTAQTFIDEFHAQNPEPAPLGMAGKRVGKANVDLSQDPFDPNRVHLEMIRADEPRKRLGADALQKTLKLADKHGMTMQLDAVPVGKGGPNESKLIEFYEKNGFKLDPTAPGATRTTMTRPGINDRLKANADERVGVEAREYTSPDAQTEKAETIKKLDVAKERVLKEHEAAQPAEEAKTAVGPPKPLFREPAEIKAAVQDTIDNIQHAVRGTADVGTGVRNPKSAKARALDVSDNAARPWISDDFEGTIKAYMRTMVPHIEMHRQFGSVTLEKEIQEISDAYRVKMAAAGSNDAAKAKLVAQRESDITDLALMRDRTLGQAGPRNNEAGAVIRAAQIARSVNYVRSLGAQLFSAIPDLGRVVARYGMTGTVQRTAQFALSSELRNMAKTDMQRMGTALDVLLHTREHSLEGTGGLDLSNKLNKVAQNATASFTKWSMIAHWDASIRLISAQLEQDAMARLVKGDNVSAFEKAKLAAHGIGDDDLAAIREQWNTHGSNEGGLNRARTELWTDKDAAQKVEQAVQRAASTNAFFIGKGDVPGFADTQMGKFLFQFKGFVMGSVERLVLPLAQGLAHGDVKAANGLAMMLSLGGLRYYLKERAAGRQPDMSPASLGPEMLQASGVLAFLPDLYDPLAALVHLPRFSKFKDHGWQETAFGPTAGMLPILGKLVEDATGGKFTAQDMHKVRQLLPYQNMFYLNRLFNLVEGKTSDALDLKNATHRPTLDYLNPAKDTDALEPEADKAHLFGIQAIPNKM